jgi:dTDP-4-dehydrorhamnose 3,5-epimerase
MKFTPIPLSGAFVIDIEPHGDERGQFARTFCTREFEARGLETAVAQCSMSWNARRGTLRGVHYQQPPHDEAKLVRVVAGAIFDVAVDVRPDSPTRGKWFGVELTAANARSFYLPRGFAHGFLTLEDASVVHYQMSSVYEPTASHGFRFDDPDVGIAWPFPPVVVSDRDLNLPAWNT